MKKIIMISLSIFSTLLIAGGDQNAPASSTVPTTSCKVEKIYIQKKEKLVWQDQYYTTSEEGAYKNEKSKGKAGNLKSARRYCANLNYAGRKDWRLPTADELRGVLDRNAYRFTYSTDGYFWTDTPTTENRYYVVFPTDAQQYKRDPKQSNYARCVRCLIEKTKYKGSVEL